MTAVALDLLSDGRLLLGLGASGPQVVEGWHGVPYGHPVSRMREYVAILREVWRRERPLENHTAHYDIPYGGPGASGLGKPLKLIQHPLRPSIPVYIGAVGPRNVALAGEIADGWLPAFFSPFHFRDVFAGPLEEGFSHRSREACAREDFDLATSVPVEVGELRECLDRVRAQIALYVGGGGGRERNFYADLVRRYGFEDAADQIQSLFLEGRREEAARAVPDELVDQVSLVGPPERILERANAWREVGVRTLICQTDKVDVVRFLAQGLL